LIEVTSDPGMGVRVEKMIYKIRLTILDLFRSLTSAGLQFC